MLPISKLADNGLVLQPNMPPISLSLTVTLNTRLSCSLVSFSFFLVSVEQEQLWGRRGWRAEMMQCGTKEPLRDKNHGLFTIPALKEQQGREHSQPAPAVVSITLQGCFSHGWIYFCYFLNAKRDDFFFSQEKRLFSKASLFQ